MRTTLKQIAEATHLSVTTVSQVLNNADCRVSKENRQLILDTAERMHYRRNRMALGLVKGSTNTIGLAISDIRNNFFASLARGVEDECKKNDWNVILCNSNDSHETDMVNLRMLADAGASGVVFGMAAESTAEMAQECITFLKKAHIPYLLADRYIDTDMGGIVSVDHVKGGYLATYYLLSRGLRRIACITGPGNLIDSQQRLEGYRRALGEYGILFRAELLYDGKYTFESGVLAAERILRMPDRPDAVFAFNDMMAIGAMKRIKEQGLHVPEDISVIGYDDIFMDSFLEVPLTTIRQPAEQMGRKAAEMLIRGEIRYKDNRERVLFDPVLIERASVAAR